MVVLDQLQREVTIPGVPQRIICLVPSITELLVDLGLENRIVGITKFCTRPESIHKSKPRIGGTKTPDHEKIRILEPDLIIANKEENNLQDIVLLQELYPVWVSDVSTLQQAVEMIQKIGEITATTEQANNIANNIMGGFEDLKPNNPVPAVYLIWKNPLMTTGSGTFINDMMLHCGFTNVFTEAERYPTTSYNQILELNPRFCLLSSEPYPFSKRDLEEIEKVLPGVNCVLVDGQYFSWYGSRMLQAPTYFQTLVKSMQAAV